MWVEMSSSADHVVQVYSHDWFQMFIIGHKPSTLQVCSKLSSVESTTQEVTLGFLDHMFSVLGLMKVATSDCSMTGPRV